MKYYVKTPSIQAVKKMHEVATTLGVHLGGVRRPISEVEMYFGDNKWNYTVFYSDEKGVYRRTDCPSDPQYGEYEILEFGEMIELIKTGKFSNNE